MRSKYSKIKNGKKSFFIKYPQINQTYFQGSETKASKDIEELFKKTEELYNIYKKQNKDDKLVSINMILFDKLGLAEKSSTKH